VDCIGKRKQIKILRGVNVEYHSMLVAAEEFQVLLPSYDTEYIATLNTVFNNPDVPYEEHRRTGAVREISISYPQLNILAGVQPSYFVSTFPEEAWTTGFARRILMIYAAEGKFQDLFQGGEEPEEGPGWSALLGALSHISNMYGCMSWEPAAAEMLAKWHRAKGPPTPTHSKLVSAVAGTGGMVIREYDVQRALSWLLFAEKRMPDVFREMVGKSDSQIIDELHYMVALEQGGKGKGERLNGTIHPVQTSTVWEFLRQRVPSDKIEKIIVSAERAGIIFHPGGATDLWQAKPITSVRGVE